MLQIKQKLHLKFPRFRFGSQREITFAPVLDDDDELTQAISNEQFQHDDEWVLDERPDTSRLSAYWAEVENDIAHDPEWTTFSDEEA